jgi:hypothetical protein
MNERANAQACLLGLACGDALGRPVEFKSAQEITADHPRAVYEVAEIFPQLAIGTGAILDYLTQLRLPQQQRTLTDTSPEAQLADLRDTAHTMVGELHVMYESLRRVAVRHPEIEHEQWQASTAQSWGR